MSPENIYLPAPTGLMCQLMEYPEKTEICTAFPEFSWIVNDLAPDSIQSARQILVASKIELLSEAGADVWNSGKVESTASINVQYSGKPLKSQQSYVWTVRVWNQSGQVSSWAAGQQFTTGTVTDEYSVPYYPLEKREIAPVRFVAKDKWSYFIDFGKDAFGTIRLIMDSPEDGHMVEIHLAEALYDETSVERQPPECIRYRKIPLKLRKGRHEYTVEIPPDKRNTSAGAVLMPPKIGEVMPFRYCELTNVPIEINASMIRRTAVQYHFDDSSSFFESSDKVLNAVWDLCKYSIKATSFCGLYVDGDRERVPYEADAYINQLCHYAVDKEFSMARRTHEYLLFNACWPTEWILHSVLIAWADYEYTGNNNLLIKHYDTLKAKTLTTLSDSNGLISARKDLMTQEFLDSIHSQLPLRDIVDWPPENFNPYSKQGERDSYDMVEINTVINSFYYRALCLMTEIAKAVGRASDAKEFARRAAETYNAVNQKLFDTERGIYVDGQSSSHASLHANMFPLAFGLVPEDRIETVADFVESRGMACSVYGAQYLLEALYYAGRDDYAMTLLTSQTDRSWFNMLRVGSTITLEAWDLKYKYNLDWNHAWGAAPVNIIPRFLMGIRPLEPGFGKILIQPQPANLGTATITIPTIRGMIQASFENNDDLFKLDFEVPANTTTVIDLKKFADKASEACLDGQVTPLKALKAGSGKHSLIIKLGN